MDTRSLQTAPNLDASTKKPRRKKLTKREKKLLKKKRKKSRKGDYWTPIDKTNCITLHLVHRSTNDPLLDIPDEPVSEWVLEPEVNCRSDYERVQRFFNEFELEDTIPHSFRSDEFIEKTSAKSMPILPSQRHNTHYNRGGLGPIYEQYDYDYEQHYRFINDSNFMPEKQTNDTSKHNKKRLKDGVEILEQYTFDEDYESDQEHKDKDDDHKYSDDELPSHLKDFEPTQHITNKELQHDQNYKDYMDLLLSDDEDNAQQEAITGDLQDDFVFQAMGVDEDEFGRIQLGSFEPYGARFAKWDEMDIHYDKYKDMKNTKSESLYDRTISHLMNIQSAKEMNNTTYLDDIEEGSECGQFDDAEETDDEDMDGTHVGSIAYDPDKSLLDNQFEIMLNQQYGDEFIGELDDELEELRGDGTFDTVNHRFSNKNKKESLRYQYYLYRKHKKRRIRQSLKRNNKEATLRLMGIHKGQEKDEKDEESDEIIYFSGSDKDEKEDIKDLDSDDERRINAEIEEEFKKEPPQKWDVESVLSTRTNHENHPMELKVNVGQTKMELKPVQSGGKMLEDIIEIKEEQSVKELEKDQMISFAFGTIGNIGNDGDGVKVIKQNNGKQIIFEFDTVDGDHGNEDEKMKEMETESADEDLENNENVVTAFSSRKGESKAERKERKTLMKQRKQQRRKEKKLHKMAFKDAQKKQVKLGVTQTQSHGNALRL